MLGNRALSTSTLVSKAKSLTLFTRQYVPCASAFLIKPCHVNRTLLAQVVVQSNCSKDCLEQESTREDLDEFGLCLLTSFDNSKTGLQDPSAGVNTSSSWCVRERGLWSTGDSWCRETAPTQLDTFQVDWKSSAITRNCNGDWEYGFRSIADCHCGQDLPGRPREYRSETSFEQQCIHNIPIG